jgi:hypothetical protein
MAGEAIFCGICGIWRISYSALRACAKEYVFEKVYFRHGWVEGLKQIRQIPHIPQTAHGVMSLTP